jgi:hypothetical protein
LAISLGSGSEHGFSRYDICHDVEAVEFVLLILLGLAVGAYGTLVGAGGGFLLVPILVIAYPSVPPQVIAATSLVVVFCNATSGSLAYARMGRVDFRAGAVFGAAAVPGALLGAAATRYLSPQIFDWILGPLLVIVGGYLTLHPLSRDHPDQCNNGGKQTPVELANSTGATLRLGAILSTLVGFLSSILGIGGGIVHVPILSRVLRFPVHVATATSHFVLAIMTLAGTMVHLVDGDLAGQSARIGALAIGVIPGAQAGALLSNRIHGALIIRSLALGLVLVGIRVAALASKG